MVIDIVYGVSVYFSHIAKFLGWGLFSFFTLFLSDFLQSEKQRSSGLLALMVSCKAFHLVSSKF